MRTFSVLLLVLAYVFASTLLLTGQSPALRELTFDRLLHADAEPQNWLMYWGNYQGTHYSALKQINQGNAEKLQTSWTVPIGGMGNLQAKPLVIDGVMFTTGRAGQVLALDARTGREIWRYERELKSRSPGGQNNPFSRGVAVLGNRVFFGTLDAAIVALDRATGKPQWETQVADAQLGYSVTQAPLALKDRIIVGVAGGEFGIRGFVDAYDPETGKRLWRFHTIPGPGEFGNETWKGDSWMRGGGPTWLTGTYDPVLNLLYWPVGNAGPDIDGSVREGDNLFTCSVLALDPETGKRKWHFQFTPGDTHDWDSTEDMILVDREFRGKPRKLLVHADRNGMFYVLDRTDGTFLAGTPFVRQTWNTGLDEKGRPIVVPGSKASPEGSIPVFPSLNGGTNFQTPSLDAATGWLILEYMESGQRFFTTPQEYVAGRQYQGGRQTRVDEPSSAGIRAIDPENGKVVWDYKMTRGSLNNGLLATGGNIVFAASPDGNLLVLDTKSGELIRSIKLANSMAASPISYSVDGKQFVAIMAGSTLTAVALPD